MILVVYTSNINDDCDSSIPSGKPHKAARRAAGGRSGMSGVGSATSTDARNTRDREVVRSHADVRFS